MIDLILNNIIGLLQVISKTFLPLFLALYAWHRWNDFWIRKISIPINDKINKSSINNENTSTHKLISFFLSLIALIIFLIGFLVIAYCIFYMVTGA
tara:strand:+ start:332 stop:619 length:288 start_codon:yes stop_codon:yes gene_type:complete